MDTCNHPMAERFTHDFGPNGYLNTPTGTHEMCGGCGHDFGKPQLATVLPSPDGYNDLTITHHIASVGIKQLFTEVWIPIQLIPAVIAELQSAIQ